MTIQDIIDINLYYKEESEMNAFTNYQNQGYNVGAIPNPMTYTGPTAQPGAPLMSNPVTPDEKKLLLSDQDVFDLKVTPKDMAFAKCTHKENGAFAITTDGQGNAYCKICGAKFTPDILLQEDGYVDDAVERIMNVLQTCKLIGIDMNEEVITQFYAIIPYLLKVPTLYRVLAKTFNKYGATINQTAPVGGQNIFGMFNNMMNPAMPLGAPAYQPQYGAPQYGYPQMTPYMAQQGQMVAGGQTPFYQQPPQGQWGAPQNGWAPQYAPNGAPAMAPNGQPMNQPAAPNGQAQPQQAAQSDGSVKVDQQVKL